jgi:hypothetical protein
MTIIIQRSTESIELKLAEPVFYIYRFCSPSGKSYVGRTKNIQRRISQHLDGEGSKLLLQDLVEYGRKAFTIEILENLKQDDFLDEVEDLYIKKYDCIHPMGYNKRTNAEPIPNGSPVDLSNIKISAKYVFDIGGKHCFTVGEASQHRSYQTLQNAGELAGLSKKKNFGFDFFEIKVERGELEYTPGVYELTLKFDETFYCV